MLLRLLTLPVSGPIDAVMWVGRKLHETADRELNDVASLKRQLSALSDKVDRGEISETEYEELELALLQRIDAAMKAAQTQGPR